MRIVRVLFVAGVVLAAGCEKKTSETPPANQGVDTVPAGNQMVMAGVRMMPLMRAHLDSMALTSPEAMAAGMPAHQDMASRMMDAMGADMRGMGMTPDSSWTALGDSLKQDLAELPALSGPALRTRMQGHAGRLRRMMEMHEGMMKM